MWIQLNGESLAIDEGASLAQLVERQALQGKRIAVEVNEELVSRGLYGECALQEGDRVEIVQAIGGG
jgi:sulfur carrier protein